MREETVALYKILIDKFTLSELRSLVFELPDVNWDSLHGGTIEEKCESLITYLDHRDNLTDLIKLGQDKRPNVKEWGALLDAIEKESETEPDFAPPEQTQETSPIILEGAEPAENSSELILLNTGADKDDIRLYIDGQLVGVCENKKAVFVVKVGIYEVQVGYIETYTKGRRYAATGHNTMPRLISHGTTHRRLWKSNTVTLDLDADKTYILGYEFSKTFWGQHKRNLKLLS
jgi:hypothetical protein